MAQPTPIKSDTPPSKSISAAFAAHRQEYIDWSKQLLERAKKLLRSPHAL